MRMKEVKRAGAAIAALVLLLVAVGCSGKKAPKIPPPPPPPPAATTPATTDVQPPPTPVDSGPVAPPQAMDLQELQDRAEREGLLGDVYYNFDSYGLDDQARQRLTKNAEFFRSSQGADLTFTVEGHCDERGTNEYNIALGQRRGATAVDYLVSLGISASRFKSISYGEERPFCTESSEACWQRNRRARFVISGRQ